MICPGLSSLTQVFQAHSSASRPPCCSQNQDVCSLFSCSLSLECSSVRHVEIVKITQMRKSKGYLFRTCCSKGVSHHHVRLAETQKHSSRGCYLTPWTGCCRKVNSRAGYSRPKLGHHLYSNQSRTKDLCSSWSQTIRMWSIMADFFIFCPYFQFRTNQRTKHASQIRGCSTSS